MTNEEVPPKSFLLCPYGEQHYTKDGKEDAFSFSPESADRVIREFHSRARDLVIDYEHQTLTGGKAPAAGWHHCNTSRALYRSRKKFWRTATFNSSIKDFLQP